VRAFGFSHGMPAHVVTSDAPGWNAIDARLAELYPDVEPKHYGTLHRFSLGGRTRSTASASTRGAEPVPHCSGTSSGTA
jgi:suppressor of fused-like protein